MSTPPRRRRTEPQRPDVGGGWLPTIAMGLAVIVAGLGIGALIAVLMQRHSAATPVALTLPTSTSVTPAPIAPTATPATVAPRPASRTPALTPAPPTPTPIPPTPSASTVATPAASASPTARATQRAVASPVPQATHATAAVPSPERVSPVSVARVAVVTSAPRPTRAPTAEPVATTSAAAAPTPGVTAAPATAAPAVAAVAEPSAYEQHAAGVVRRYIDALVRGDRQSAYSALGQSAGATGSLPEQAFLDPSAHIVSLKVTRIDAANASVGCEIASAKGHYYGTYHVTAGGGGAYISEHDYIKV